MVFECDRGGGLFRVWRGACHVCCSRDSFQYLVKFSASKMASLTMFKVNSGALDGNGIYSSGR